jgi:mono/diheme cytochrome c family protein
MTNSTIVGPGFGPAAGLPPGAATRKIALLIVFLLTTLPALAADQPQGKTLYIDKYMCYTCHGYSGQTGPGAPLVPMKMSQEAFIAYVRNPRQPNRMPSFSAKVVSDSELGEIYNYIKSLPNSHPDPKTVPLLKDLLK